MKRNYFTSKANAQETMHDNFYKKVNSCSDEEYSAILYVNVATEASAVIKTYKKCANKECDTLVQIFTDNREGREYFRTIKNWMK